MSLQLSQTARNARLDAIETAIGTAPQLRFYTGAQPTDCATAEGGTLLATLTLPADYLSNAATGTKAKLGTWSGTGNAGLGAPANAGHFRIYDSAGSVCHMQGTVTAVGGGGDMTLDNVSIAANQAITVNSFTLTDGNP